jgi:uncharacterized protein YycO
VGGRTGQIKKRTNRNRMKKQTAVQWLVNEIAEKYNFRFATYYGQEIQKALEMEKEQMISFGYIQIQHVDAEIGDCVYNKVPEEIYNETYGGAK